MAHACAAQTNAICLKLASPQFVQMFIGDRVKLESPCIIFKDEIDAIDRKRFYSEVGGDMEFEYVDSSNMFGRDNSAHDAPSKLSPWWDWITLVSKNSYIEDGLDGSSITAQPSLFGMFTKGIVDSSKNAMKVVQVKARHVVSQNKRRYRCSN
ncbi:hypothetical protein AAG906_040821 [Vitis piasezkii]